MKKYVDGTFWPELADWRVDEGWDSAVDPGVVPDGSTVIVEPGCIDDFLANVLPKIRGRVVVVAGGPPGESLPASTTARPLTPGAAGLVRDGDVVFVKTDLLDAFVKDVLPGIRARDLTLVSAVSDLLPSADATLAITRSPSVRRWSAVHDVENFKIRALPLGVSDRFPDHGAFSFDAYRAPPRRRRAWLPPTNSDVHPLRAEVAGLRHPNLDSSVGRMDHAAYLRKMLEYEYVVSPVGCGVDVFRTYEALLMRAVPIFVADPGSPVPAAYARFPVVVVWGVDGLRDFLDRLPPPPAVDWAAVESDLRVENAKAYLL